LPLNFWRVSPPKQVDKPTGWEFIGPAERFDQRDHANSRLALRIGTPEYEDYYKRHPELKEKDDAERELFKRSDERLRLGEPINYQLSIMGTLGYGRRILAQNEFCTGEPSPNKVEIDPKVITEKIKALALAMGTDKVGITYLNENWIYTYRAHPYDPVPYGETVELPYKYIICMAFKLPLSCLRNAPDFGSTSASYWTYSRASLPAVILARIIRELGYEARATPPGNTPFFVVPHFVMAGIGEYSRMGICVTKEFGAAFKPSSVLTNMPLEVDKPVDFGLQRFCRKCKICAKNCPSGAISSGDWELVRGYRRWRIDGEKCRHFWDTIGRECSICVVSCPWTRMSNINRNLAVHKVFQDIYITLENRIYKRKIGPRPTWLKVKA